MGGTQKWCPKCLDITVCKAVNPSTLGVPSGQRMHFEHHVDINFFRRGLICLACDYEFITAEVDEKFLDELVELRKALSVIKSNAEEYIDESNAASKSLAKLSDSLNVLRALNLYKNAKS
jgi:hypothetical protein